MTKVLDPAYWVDPNKTYTVMHNGEERIWNIFDIIRLKDANGKLRNFEIDMIKNEVLHLTEIPFADIKLRLAVPEVGSMRNGKAFYDYTRLPAAEVPLNLQDIACQGSTVATRPSRWFGERGMTQYEIATERVSKKVRLSYHPESDPDESPRRVNVRANGKYIGFIEYFTYPNVAADLTGAYFSMRSNGNADIEKAVSVILDTDLDRIANLLLDKLKQAVCDHYRGMHVNWLPRRRHPWDEPFDFLKDHKYAKAAGALLDGNTLRSRLNKRKE